MNANMASAEIAALAATTAIAMDASANAGTVGSGPPTATMPNDERSRRALLSLLEDERRAEARLKTVNRALRTLSAGNEVLVHALEEDALLRRMVDVIADKGGYPVAWVGYARDDAARTVKAMATRGIEIADLQDPVISYADNERGQSAVGRAIRTGERQLVKASDGGYLPWKRLLDTKGIRAILGLPLRLAGAPPFGALAIAAHDGEVFDAEEIALLEELASGLAYGVGNLRNVAAREAATRDLRTSLESTIEALAATVDARDPYTAGHQRRVAALAAAIGREMGMPSDVVDGIHFGALIHDVGKIQVPGELLAKPGRLSPVEFELIKTHATAGFNIVRDIRFPWPVADMVHQHHERLDGSGYPQGLKGKAIALEARIIAVADVVEAMASHRPYRPTRGLDAALEEIHAGRGTTFDADCVDACIRVIRERSFAWDEMRP